jgi:hypothetical protein
MQQKKKAERRNLSFMLHSVFKTIHHSKQQEKSDYLDQLFLHLSRTDERKNGCSPNCSERLENLPPFYRTAAERNLFTETVNQATNKMEKNRPRIF